MHPGVRAHDFGKLPVEDLAARIGAHGLTRVQLAVAKALAGFDSDDGGLTPALGARVRAAFAANGIQISVLGCYINLVDPDPASLGFHLGRFKEHLRVARDFGCGVVGTETGSLNADGSWHPDNAGEAAFARVLAGVRELAREAERAGSRVGIEGVERYVVDSPRRLARLVDEVDSGSVGVILDPVNLLNARNHGDQAAILEEAFSVLGGRIAVLHAKDFVVEDGAFRTVPAGRGRLDYGLFLRLAKALDPSIDILLEDTAPATIAESIRFLKTAWDLA